ncbi:MAG: L-threonine 3-dehydrogenase [Candidatus Thermoplasmatota archaeon]|nr:L-threonine 3-dehydrogenase [Candidatus Thermoplasmatota archaeon]
MKALVKLAPVAGGTKLKSVAVPEVGYNEVLIKTKLVSICGTDLHIYNWDSWAQQHIKIPRIYGHEFAGVVTELGEGVTDLRKGDYVSGEGHLACGECYQCKTGSAHICINVKGLGIDTDGAFAEYLKLPSANVWKNAKGLEPEIASVQDPLGNAVHTVFSVDVVGKDVAIFGCGPTGLMAVAVCKFIGASKVYAVGRKNIYRLELAKKLGADMILKSEDAIKSILKDTDGKGVDVALEMAGSSEALNQALKVVRAGGQVAILGLYQKPVELDVSNDVVLKCIKLQGIYGRLMYDTWYRMKGLLQAGLNIKPIITHKFNFEDFEDAFKLANSGNCGKVILELK